MADNNRTNWRPWLMLGIALIVVIGCADGAGPPATNPQPTAKVSPATPTPVVERPTRVAPSPTPASPSIPESVLAAGREAKALYEELQGFKDDPDFRQVGFAVCCKYNKWLKSAEALRDRTDVQFLAVYGFGAADLATLGMTYVAGGNAKWLEDRIEEGLAQLK